MNRTDLLTPILEGGIHNANFFNGRLLTGEDMQREQVANRLQHQQLGQAIGEGVAYGLEVRAKKDVASPPGKPSRIVTVSAGMALNRLGQALHLPSATDVALVRETEVVAEEAGLFKSCEPPKGTDLLSYTGSGVYILVIAPASGFEGRAPVSGLGGDISGRSGCRRRDAVEGVQFRLVEMKLESLKNVSQATRDQIAQHAANIEKGTENEKNLSKLRNLLAHLCFGTEELAGFVRDPFRREEENSPFGSGGALEALRSRKSPALTDCDVPLALIYWAPSGIQFVDMWSVRRKVAPKPISLAWPVLNERRLVEAEAVFLQFQEQIGQMAGPGVLQSELSLIEAASWFRYLPAAGVMPVNSGYIVKYMQEQGATSFKAKAQLPGIEPASFFKGLTCRKAVFIEGTKIGQLLRDSFCYPAIDLDSPDREMIWLYFVRENIEALVKSSPPQTYILFANGHMPYLGNARDDLARWGYSSYASV